jgi:hypothetical protein
MSLSIRDASRFVIGATIIRDMTARQTPEHTITVEDVATMALRDDPDGERLRAAIDKLADRENAWFRATPSHTLATPRVMESRMLKTVAINNIDLAVLGTLEFAADAASGNPEARNALQDHLQAAVQAIDEMPGSTNKRRLLLKSLADQTREVAPGMDLFLGQELGVAQKAYLDRLREARLSAYSGSSPSRDRGGDLKLGS